MIFSKFTWKTSQMCGGGSLSHYRCVVAHRLSVVFLNYSVYLMMTDVDPGVMNMFTQDYGLTALELTHVSTPRQ